MIFKDFDPVTFAIRIIVIFVAIGIHEFTHCKLADLAGDPTPRSQGRVTLNLFKHFDPVGSMMIVLTSLIGFGIGWGKPAPMDPRKMNNPRWDFFIAVLGGPLSNLVQATLYGVVLRALLRFDPEIPDIVGKFLLYGVIINISLALFNLIPLGPLDGHWLVGLLMPDKARLAWWRFNAQAGTGILFLLIFISQFSGSAHIPSPLEGLFILAEKISAAITGLPLG